MHENDGEKEAEYIHVARQQFCVETLHVHVHCTLYIVVYISMYMYQIYMYISCTAIVYVHAQLIHVVHVRTLYM